MILIINPGSSSIKYQLFGLRSKKLFQIKFGSKDQIKDKAGFQKAASLLLSEFGSYSREIAYVGYRIVHGGSELDDGISASDQVLKSITEYDELAPLHNPPAVYCIEYFKQILTHSKHLCYFDTTFFNNLPQNQVTYPLPQQIINRFKIRRYGFHGISHEFAYYSVKPKKNEKAATIHLGAGCSITAIKNGQPTATSMGFTPLEGLVMQTRSGDIDPGLVIFLVEKLGLKKTKDVLSHSSGLAGLTHTAGDMLDLLYLASEKIEDPNYLPPKDLHRNKSNFAAAQLALMIFCQSIQKYLGGYSTIMGGLDRVIFTGKIGYGSNVIRKRILKNLDFIKIKNIDVVAPNEELAIAQKIVKQFGNEK